MTDRYTKIMLTVIAVALTTIASRQFLETAEAQTPPCGAQMNPCAVYNVYRDGYEWKPCYKFDRGCYAVGIVK